MRKLDLKPTIVVFALVIAGCMLLLFHSGSKSTELPSGVTSEHLRAESGAQPETPHKLLVQDPAAVRPPNLQDAITSPGIEEMMRWDFTGIVITISPDGMQSMDLEGRFTHVSAAVPDQHGNLRIQCFSGYPAMQTAMGAAPSVPATAREGASGVVY